MIDEKAKSTVAKALYEAMEGPVSNQDFARQQRQWDSAQALAVVAIEAYESSKPKEAEEFVRVPKERYRELVAEELWNAFNCGIERDGKWMDGGRSEGEWLVRRLGLPDDGWHDAEVMKGMMAAAVDRAMLSAAGDGDG